MRLLLTCTLIAPLLVTFGACARRQDDSQPPSTGATAPAYPPNTQGYPPPQPTYAQPYPNQYPAPTATYGQPSAISAPPAASAPGATPAPAAPAASPSPMAVPGPIAFQCQNDVPCGTHHCNLQYGKCAFPCQSAADCIPPNQCGLGLCVPIPAASH